MSGDATTPPAPPARPFIGALDWLNGLAAVILAVFLTSFAVRNSDFWLHLACGRLIAAGQYTFGLDPFSALSPAPVWINHAWLFDWLCYFLVQHAGEAAVVVVKAVLMGLLAVVMMATRRPESERWSPAVFTAMAFLAMSPRLVLQPAIFSYLFLGTLIFLLLRPNRLSRWPFVAVVGILFALWVNLDGGFWIGLGVLALWLIGGVLQQTFSRAASSAEAAATTPSDRAFVLIAALAACLLNPYGFKVFSLPSDWALLSLPAKLQTEQVFQDFFRKPLDRDYLKDVVGYVPGGAYFLLLGLGLGSFLLNSSGWRWDRALIWLALAGASLLWIGRLVPFFAIVAAPITVLNLQSASRPSDQPEDARAAFARSFVGGFGRFVTFLVALGMLAAAWMGGLAKDAGGSIQERRVSWSLAPDESWVLAAKQLASWYDSGRLRAGDSCGFHVPFQFGSYCAWYCPAEKIAFDARMTNPGFAETYVSTRKAILNMRERPDEAPMPPATTPRFTHVVLAGPVASITSRGFLYRNDRFPLWAIAGQCLIASWRDSGLPDAFPDLRLDAVKLALSESRVPPPATYAAAPVVSTWERFLRAPRLPPPESHEAALWLTDREAAGARAGPALSMMQIAGSIARAAPMPNDLVARLCEPIFAAQLAPPMAEAWQRGPDGRIVRVTPLLAIHSARRGILANPDDYEVYMRLVAAYDLFDGDQPLIGWRQTSFNQLQQITACRQALARLPLAAAYGQFTGTDERALQSILFRHYERMPVAEGLSVTPVDLLLEAYDRIVKLEVELYQRRRETIDPNQRANFDQAYEKDHQQKVDRLAKLEQDVKRRSDEFENRAASLKPADRGVLAARFGLVREALAAFRSADPNDLKTQHVILLINLLLVAGETEDAHSILQGQSFNPITVLPPELQPTFRNLALTTAAALGDAATATELFEPLIQMQPNSFASPLAGILQWLIFPELGTTPLTRGVMTPVWFGLFPKDGQAMPGQLIQLQDAVQQYCNNLVRQGLLALEGSDPTMAKTRFRRALDVAGPAPFHLRAQAEGWLRLLP